MSKKTRKKSPKTSPGKATRATPGNKAVKSASASAKKPPVKTRKAAARARNPSRAPANDPALLPRKHRIRPP